MGKSTYREERKKQILAVSATLFANKTYSRTSLQDIASGFKFQKQSLYYFFKAKEDIFYEIMITPISDLLKWVKLITASKKDTVERLRAIIAMHAYGFFLEQHMPKVYVQEKWDVLRPSRRRELKTLERQYDDTIQGILRDGIESGIFRLDIDAKITEFLIIGMLFHMARWYSPKGRLSIEEIVNNCLNLVLRGLFVSERDATVKLDSLDWCPNWLERLRASLETQLHEESI